jgi:DNA-directed RNA polymerase specialized sigma24 family protein
VLVLCDLEERSAPEVAAMIGAPVGTVYSRLHGARPAFRQALLREGIAPVAEADNVVPLRRPQ